MRRTILAFVVCALFVGLATPASASESSLSAFDTLSVPVLQLIKDESLQPLYFDREGNLTLRSVTGHEVVMTQSFLAEYGNEDKGSDDYLRFICPCPSLGKIWDIAKELYVVFCLCREFLDRCGAVWEGWGECKLPGYYFITCDIINGVVYWR